MKFSVILLVLFFIGCADKPCREPQSPEQRRADQKGLEPVADAPSVAKPTEGRVFVAKSDGSKQCDAKKGTPLETAEKQLKGIKIYSRENKSDGMMRIQMCGASSGRFNVFEIENADLAKAKSFGFQEWK